MASDRYASLPNAGSFRSVARVGGESRASLLSKSPAHSLFLVGLPLLSRRSHPPHHAGYHDDGQDVRCHL